MFSNISNGNTLRTGCVKWWTFLAGFIRLFMPQNDCERGSAYQSAVSQARLSELLRVQQLGLKAPSKVTSVCLLQHCVKSLSQHQVCVLNPQQVLRRRVEQAVPITYMTQKHRLELRTVASQELGTVQVLVVQ